MDIGSAVVRPHVYDASMGIGKIISGRFLFSTPPPCNFDSLQSDLISPQHSVWHLLALSENVIPGSEAHNHRRAPLATPT